jgi:hypothetical protein
MLDYLLPALRSSQQLFALPDTWAKQLVRRRLWRLAGTAGLALVAAAGVSVAALSLLPIDECDLLAASDVDDFRIGPSVHLTALQTFYPDKVRTACENALTREPGNGRFWYQLSRIDTPSRFGTALESATKSAQLGYPAGFISIGYFYDHGIGVPIDLDEAQRHFEKAVELGNWQALYNLSVVASKKGQEKQYFERMQQYVDRGGSLTYYLAVFYLRNDFVRRDTKKYIKLLKLGADRGDGDASTRLGNEYDYGTYVENSPILAAKYFEKGVRLSVDPVAASNLALKYRHGNGVPKKYGKSNLLGNFRCKAWKWRGHEYTF